MPRKLIDELAEEVLKDLNDGLKEYNPNLEVKIRLGFTDKIIDYQSAKKQKLLFTDKQYFAFGDTVKISFEVYDGTNLLGTFERELDIFDNYILTHTTFASSQGGVNTLDKVLGNSPYEQWLQEKRLVNETFSNKLISIERNFILRNNLSMMFDWTDKDVLSLFSALGPIKEYYRNNLIYRWPARPRIDLKYPIILETGDDYYHIITNMRLEAGISINRTFIEFTGPPIDIIGYRAETKNMRDYVKGVFYGPKNSVEQTYLRTTNLDPFSSNEIDKEGGTTLIKENLHINKPWVVNTKRGLISHLADEGNLEALA